MGRNKYPQGNRYTPLAIVTPVPLRLLQNNGIILKEVIYQEYFDFTILF